MTAIFESEIKVLATVLVRERQVPEYGHHTEKDKAI